MYTPICILFSLKNSHFCQDRCTSICERALYVALIHWPMLPIWLLSRWHINDVSKFRQFSSRQVNLITTELKVVVWVYLFLYCTKRFLDNISNRQRELTAMKRKPNYFKNDFWAVQSNLCAFQTMPFFKTVPQGPSNFYITGAISKK